jgi:hypothetical protein
VCYWGWSFPPYTGKFPSALLFQLFGGENSSAAYSSLKYMKIFAHSRNFDVFPWAVIFWVFPKVNGRDRNRKRKRVRIGRMPIPQHPASSRFHFQD